jgi:hypothetical protein
MCIDASAIDDDAVDEVHEDILTSHLSQNIA